jgi:hypothetical protein
VNLSKTSIQTLRHVVLVPPTQDRKYFLRCWKGTVEPIADSENLTQDGPSLYFRSKYRGDFEALRREVEIALKKGRATAASALLAEAVIAMAAAYRQIGATDAVDKLLDNTLSVGAIVFIGLPEETACLGDGAVEAFLGFRFGRFTVGVEALRAHDRLFGKEKRSANYEKVSGYPGLWFMREPLDCTLLAAAFDQRISSMTRDYYLLLIGSELGYLRDEFLADQRIFAALDVPTFDGERIFHLHGLRIDVAFGESATTQTMLLDYATSVIPSGIGQLGESAKRLNSHTTIPFGRCSGIDPSLNNFAAFLQKANAHELGGRSSDAFIHYVFALDLLFGRAGSNLKCNTQT